MTKTTFIVTDNGGLLNLKLLLKDLEWARHMNWAKRKWKCQPALIDKSRESIHLYTGQKFNTNHFKLVEGAWKHDHCDICTDRIEAGDTIYSADNEIICPYCYSAFIIPKDIQQSLNKMVKVQK